MDILSVHVFHNIRREKKDQLAPKITPHLPWKPLPFISINLITLVFYLSNDDTNIRMDSLLLFIFYSNLM